nr:uncharacterized protein LOC125422019 [Ziziphus jujuba var. spinosa]
MAIDVWKHSDYLSQNDVLDSLSDTLYGVYYITKSEKELWETLDRKYKTENVGSEKFIVGRFLNYVMVDTKPLMSQVYELQVFIQELLAKGIIINEPFQIATMIEKLSPSWGDFRNYLKHKKKEIDMEALVGKLCIEDDNRRSDKRFMKAMVKANVVEYKTSSKNKKKLGQSSKGPKGCISKKAKEWWIDTDATRHVCSNKNLFTSFKLTKDGEKLFIGNFATSKIQRDGKIVLKMTSGKKLTLNNVLYVLDIRKNLVFGSILSKHDFYLVFESDKVIFSKYGIKMKVIRSDRGGEYVTSLREYSAQHGIIHEVTPPYSPQSNSVVE